MTIKCICIVSRSLANEITLAPLAASLCLFMFPASLWLYIFISTATGEKSGGRRAEIVCASAGDLKTAGGIQEFTKDDNFQQSVQLPTFTEEQLEVSKSEVVR